MANAADTPFRRWARANFTTSFLYPLMVSRDASHCPLMLYRNTGAMKTYKHSLARGAPGDGPSAR